MKFNLLASLVAVTSAVKLSQEAAYTPNSLANLPAAYHLPADIQNGTKVYHINAYGCY